MFETEELRNLIRLRCIALRQNANLYQRELAEKLGVKRHVIAHLENDNENLSINKLWKICYVFGIGLDEFFNDSSFKQYFNKHLTKKGR